MWLGCREASESTSQHSPQGEISLREYDATACIIFTELVEMRLGELARRIHFAYPTRRSTSSLSSAECGYLRRRRTIPLIHTVHYHRIFNFFRNIFRNAIFDCFRSARKVSVYKAFLRFCVCIARKFSRPPRYDHFDIPP